MGERLLCKQEVVGSIPITSTRAGRRLGRLGVSREVKGLAAFSGLFFAIVDRVNLDLAAGVRGYPRGWFGGIQVLMNESNFERRPRYRFSVI